MHSCLLCPLWLFMLTNVDYLLQLSISLDLLWLNYVISSTGRYLNAIQTNAHHLLRYLATAAIVNKRRRNVLKELIKVIQQERYTYSDPVTEFLECLYVNYDFDGAQKKLRECEEVWRKAHVQYVALQICKILSVTILICLETHVVSLVISAADCERLFLGQAIIRQWFCDHSIEGRVHGKCSSVHFWDLLSHPPVHWHRNARSEAEHELRWCRKMDREPHS